MNNLPPTWKAVKLREIARNVRRPITISPHESYRTMGVKWWGMGAYERETKAGTEIKASKMYAVKPGDLVINKIWVRNGSSGIVGQELDGCVVTSDFPTYLVDQSQVLIHWLEYIFKSWWFWSECEMKSRGTSGRQRIDPEGYLDIVIPLPPLEVQQRIEYRIAKVEQRIDQIKLLQEKTEKAIYGVLYGVYQCITSNTKRQPMAEVAPLIRRSVRIEPDEEYPELGLRSWGKGTFHKPAVRGSELNGKRIYRIETGDLLFSNVFSWEGAVAVARPEDHGRFGSHRYITRVVKPDVASAQFLYFHFMTEEGLQQLRHASPGSAGRNRTLGLKALDAIEVPVPDYKLQCRFDDIFRRLEGLKREQDKVREKVEALLPAVLDKAFRGEL